jgi:acyl-CoA reductase-like NAD-dependent aldehyde dehydrogenase
MFLIVLCRSIEPTLLLNPPLDSDIMTEEIFGPLLPIITVRMTVLADALFLAESEWSRRYLC